MKKEKVLRGEVVPPIWVSQQIKDRAERKLLLSANLGGVAFRTLQASIVSYLVVIGADIGFYGSSVPRPFEVIEFFARASLGIGAFLSAVSFILHKNNYPRYERAKDHCEAYIRSQSATRVSKVAK